jgi:hypothetical protein
VSRAHIHRCGDVVALASLSVVALVELDPLLLAGQMGSAPDAQERLFLFDGVDLTAESGGGGGTWLFKCLERSFCQAICVVGLRQHFCRCKRGSRCVVENERNAFLGTLLIGKTQEHSGLLLVPDADCQKNNNNRKDNHQRDNSRE